MAKAAAIISGTGVFLCLLFIAWNQANQQYESVGLSTVGWFIFIPLGVVIFGYAATKWRTGDGYAHLEGRISAVEANVLSLGIRVGKFEMRLNDLQERITQDNWRVAEKFGEIYVCEPAGFEAGQTKYLAYPTAIDLDTYLSLMKVQPQENVQGIFYLTEGD